MRKLLTALLCSLVGAPAFANTCTSIQAGATSQSVYVELIDETTGIPTAGLAWNEAGIDLEYVRSGAAAVEITEATQTANGAYSSGGFVSVGHGRYRLDLPDAAVAAGVRNVVVQGVITGYILLPCDITLSTVETAVDTVDNFLDTEIADIRSALGPDTTTIATLASQTSFTLTAGSADDNAYNGWGLVIRDSATAAQRALGCVLDYTGATKTITLREDPAIYTMAVNDLVYPLPSFCTATVDVGLIEGTDATDALQTAAAAAVNAEDGANFTAIPDLDTLVALDVLVTQACDSGSTTTCVDAALTEAAADYWRGTAFRPLTGPTGQLRCVVDFDPATDTLTFVPALTAAITTNTYQLVRDTNCIGVNPSYTP